MPWFILAAFLIGGIFGGSFIHYYDKSGTVTAQNAQMKVNNNFESGQQGIIFGSNIKTDDWHKKYDNLDTETEAYLAQKNDCNSQPVPDDGVRLINANIAIRTNIGGGSSGMSKSKAATSGN